MKHSLFGITFSLLIITGLNCGKRIIDKGYDVSYQIKNNTNHAVKLICYGDENFSQKVYIGYVDPITKSYFGHFGFYDIPPRPEQISFLDYFEADGYKVGGIKFVFDNEKWIGYSICHDEQCEKDKKNILSVANTAIRIDNIQYKAVYEITEDDYNNAIPCNGTCD